jgi:hypothetical protein
VKLGLAQPADEDGEVGELELERRYVELAHDGGYELF